MRGVERSLHVSLAQRDGPLCEVPHVDHLRRSLRRRGASTSPPRATRCGQYVKRPVGSCGPTISPGLYHECRPVESIAHDLPWRPPAARSSQLVTSSSARSPSFATGSSSSFGSVKSA